jgi:hypothetical protein
LTYPVAVAQGTDKDSTEQRATALCYLITDASQVSDVTGPLAVELAASVASSAVDVGMSLDTAMCIGRWVGWHLRERESSPCSPYRGVKREIMTGVRGSCVIRGHSPASR